MNAIHRTEVQGPIYGPVHTGSGDIIFADFERAFKELARLLTTDHPALKSLRSGIMGLVAAYERLNEWKELHHQLQALLLSFDTFRSIVDMAYGSGERPNVLSLRRYWLQCKIRLDGLKLFAGNIKHIGTERYIEDEGGIRGEPWVVDLVMLAGDIERMLEDSVDFDELQRVVDDFGAKCFAYLEYADRKLKEETTQIYGALQSLRGRIISYGVGESGP